MNSEMQTCKMDGSGAASQPLLRSAFSGLTTLSLKQKGVILAPMADEARDEVQKFLRAIGANRYRISVLRFPDPTSENNEKKTSVKVDAANKLRGKAFIFGKAAGREWHTPEQVLVAMPELLRLDARGENIYLTPISEDVHHILIDDINMEKLARMVKAGFQPSFVLQSSSTSWQALLNVNKLGIDAEQERIASNALMVLLNKTLEFGDPKITGGVHPFRLPRTHNWKPERRLPDGSRFAVRLLSAEARKCPKSFALLQQIQSELLVSKSARAEHPTASRTCACDARDRAVSAPLDGVAEIASSDAVRRASGAYVAHRRDILSRHIGDVDESRVDFMIAVRLRTTGHSKAAIRDAMRDVGLADRAASSMHSNWSAYCQRTANAAWGPRGDYEVNHLAVRWQGTWARLERRGLSRGGLS